MLCVTVSVRWLPLVKRLVMFETVARMLVLFKVLVLMILLAVVPISGGLLRKTAFRLWMTTALLSTVGMQVLFVAYEFTIIVTRGTPCVDSCVRPQKTWLKRLWLGKILLRSGRKVLLELMRHM